MKHIASTILFYLAITFFSCTNSATHKSPIKDKKTITGTASFVEKPIVYKSEQLIIQQLSAHVYQHISFLQTNDFGKVSCNGMIVVNDDEAVVFDTPADNISSEELIRYVDSNIKAKIKAVIPTHFHKDCVGGLEMFTKSNIPAYASQQTISLLTASGSQLSKPINAFNDSMVLQVGNKDVLIKYFGEGHTKDNVIGWFASEKAVFGGCLIKAKGASKGNLEDANTAAWSGTVGKLKKAYPDANIVVPGHGKTSGTELFDYTIQLFE